MKRAQSAVIAAITTVSAVGALTVAASPASADRSRGDRHVGHDHDRARAIELQDDCDPVTFTAALGPGACSGDGGTTFDDLVASLVAGDPDDKWRIHPDEIEVRRGRDLALVNTGGEFHTFTEVEQIGPGCVPELNDLLGLAGPPAADCAAALADTATALPAGAHGRVETDHMSLGTHFFECVVHPWMTAKVVVRRR